MSTKVSLSLAQNIQHDKKIDELYMHHTSSTCLQISNVLLGQESTFVE